MSSVRFFPSRSPPAPNNKILKVLGYERQLVIYMSLAPHDAMRLHSPIDPNSLDDLVCEDKLLAVRRTLEQQIASRVDTRAMHYRHEYPVVGVFSVHQLVLASAP